MDKNNGATARDRGVPSSAHAQSSRTYRRLPSCETTKATKRKGRIQVIQPRSGLDMIFRATARTDRWTGWIVQARGAAPHASAPLQVTAPLHHIKHAHTDAHARARLRLSRSEPRRRGGEGGESGGAREDLVAEVDETVALLALRQSAARVYRRLRVESREVLGSPQPGGVDHNLARVLHVPFLAELAADERLELGEVLGRVEHGCRREAELHVLQARLAQRLAATGEVEQVVDHLEREAEVIAELLRSDSDVRLEFVAREQCRRLARVGHQGGGLAVRLGQVVLHVEPLLGS
mmetsp:Transcript_26223/g.56591  ORF Transcript_26223/g.56591 Transcript_26223/m.56591 type:complete len:293 (+) Transcript_26223:194-1072(+)